MRLSQRSPLVALATCAALLAVFVPAASAATTEIGFSIATFPAGAFTPPGVSANTSTGSYDGYAYTGPCSNPLCQYPRTEQVRGGAVVPRIPGNVTVQAGDVFRIVRPEDGAVLAQTTFDGQPTLSDATCVGQSGFVGTRTPDAAVSVRAFGAFEATTLGRYTPRKNNIGRVRTLGDGTFAGVFDEPLGAGDLIRVSQTVETIAGGTHTTVDTSVTRVVGGCPPPTPPVVDKTSPQITSFELGAPSSSVRSFLRFGLKNFVGINEPGTVSQSLYLDNGAKLPATSAKAKRKNPKPKLVLLATGRTRSSIAGVVKVTLKPTKAARTALKGKTSARVVLLTTVRDLAGNTVSLKPKRMVLKAT
jgi:hypothetical protein